MDLVHISKFVSEVGLGALIFVIWYLYHKDAMKRLHEIIEAQNTREEENSKRFDMVISQQEATRKQEFELLKDMTSTNLLQVASLTRIEQKIDNVVWCPYYNRKPDKHGKECRNESTNYASKNGIG
jgi:histidinol phosphatase-like enzyme